MTKLSTVALIVGLAACGGGGASTQAPAEPTEPTPPTRRVIEDSSQDHDDGM